MTPQDRRDWGYRVGVRDARCGRVMSDNPFIRKCSAPEMHFAWIAGFQGTKKEIEEDDSDQREI